MLALNKKTICSINQQNIHYSYSCKILNDKAMKNTLLRTVVIFVALCIYPSIHAYDFEYDGFYYDITSDSTVSVTYEGSTEYQYEGDIIIPEKATFNNKTYQVSEIGPFAFFECNIGTISIPNNIIAIRESAFTSSSLDSINIGSGVLIIEPSAFSYCNLGHINIPDNVTRIGHHAFYASFGLETVIIGNGVTQIEQSTFHFCPNLKHIALGNNTTSIGAEAFLSCDSLKYIELPNSISEIGKNAFSSCDALSSITLSENLSEIKEQTFSNCTSLSSIIIPDKVSTIATSAFSGCNHLVSLRLGTGVTDISYWAFKSAPLKEIYAFSETPPTVHYTNSYTNSFDADIFNQCTLYVPAGSLQAYKNAEVWKNFKNIVENDFTGIERPSPDKAKIFGNKNSIAFRNIEPGTDISIYDTTGKCIKTFAVDGDSEIPFPSGIYLIKYAGKTVKIIL